MGLGILPLIGGLAALVRPQGEPRDRGRTAFTIVAASALVTFGWYTAIKGAYLSTVFSTEIVERNLIYLDPILFTGTALLISRRGTRWWWALASGACGIYLVSHLRYATAVQFPYYEGHGLAITAFANRVLEWPLGTIRGVGIATAVVATAIVLSLRYLPARGRAAGASIAAICAAVLVWNVTAETYAAQGEYHLSHNLARNYTRPFDWVEGATGGRPTVLVGQQFADPNGVYLTEFWNASIRRVWSVDPTSPAPGPGPTLTPDLASPDGTMTPSPGTEFALAVNGVALQAPVVARAPDGSSQTVYRLDGGPLRLAFSQTGVESDGWATASAAGAPTVSAYNRFDAASLGQGFAKVTVDRVGGGPPRIQAQVTVRLGELVIGSDKQPALGRVIAVRHYSVGTGKSHTLLFKNPARPFRIEVTISPTFSPHEVDPRSSDIRHLGGHVNFGFVQF